MTNFFHIIEFMKPSKLFKSTVRYYTNILTYRCYDCNISYRIPWARKGWQMEKLRRSAFRFAVMFPRNYTDFTPGMAPRTKIVKHTSFMESAVEAVLVMMRLAVVSSVAFALLVVYLLTRVAYTNVFPNMLLRAIEFLGPTFIKFGQWVSTRRDLFPEELCSTLARLQHDTPAHSWLYTRSILEATYGPNWQKLFVKFDSEVPIGSGCCAQVYKAWINRNVRVHRIFQPQISRLVELAECLSIGHLITSIERMVAEHSDQTSNETYPEKLYPVAVKVLHPRLETQLNRDLCIMRGLAAYVTYLAPSLSWLSLPDCVEEFSHIMGNQVDMELEASNLKRFSRNFSNVDDVIFPQPYVEFTRRGILVESFHEGLTIAEYLDHSDKDLQQKLAKIGVTAVLKMVFTDNFVHCDLHPGNILVQESNVEYSGYLSRLGPLWTLMSNWFGNHPRLVILDCGIVASLNERCRQNLCDVFRSVALGQGQQAGDYILNHSVHMTPDPVGFRTTMGRIVDRHLAGRLTLNNINVSTVVAELFSAMIRYQVKQDGAFSSVILSMAVIEGLSRSLDPQIDIITEVLPFVADTHVSKSRRIQTTEQNCSR